MTDKDNDRWFADLVLAILPWACVVGVIVWICWIMLGQASKTHGF